MTAMSAAPLQQAMRITPSAKASSSTLRPLISPRQSPPSSTSLTTPSQSASSLLISHIDPSTLPPSLSPSRKSKTLYEHLFALPNNGVGTRVRQVKWAARGIDVPWGYDFKGPIVDATQRKASEHLCYWEVTKARIRLAGEKRAPHGKVWGRLVWRGAHITGQGKEERIRGGLKYSWDAAK